MNHKLWLLTICTVFFISPPLAAYAENFQSDLQENQQQQMEAKNKLTEVQEQKLQVQEEIETSTKKIEKLDEKISKTKESITNKEKKIARFKAEIENLNKEYTIITDLLTQREEEFKQRVASYYRTEGTNVISKCRFFR